MKILILVMIILAGIGIFISWLYYRKVNSSEDPRSVKAREFLIQFDRLMQDGDYEASFSMLDSAETIYRRIPCYSESFEMGVIHNNRGSALLSMAIYKTTDSIQKSKMLFDAEKEIRQSIRMYTFWKQRFDTISKDELKIIAIQCMPVNDSAIRGFNYQRLVQKRIRDLELAKIENNRRLSVAWSNLGIIQRHQYQQDSAIISYMTALKLWKRNPSAKNNLNTLLGKPLEDESIIDMLFPPDRKKPD